MTGDPFLTIATARDPQQEAVIAGGLAEYNRDVFGRVDAQTLDILVRDDNSGEVVGGLLGHTSIGMLFLDLFHLPRELRGAGLGSRIVELAEREGRRRGCSAAVVCTVTFQAPGFYERLGYRRFGEIDCPPDGATRIFLTKPLTRSAKVASTPDETLSVDPGYTVDQPAPATPPEPGMRLGVAH